MAGDTLEKMDYYIMRGIDMRRTKIVCTLGPATEKEEVLRQLMLEGMSVARLNFSHGTHEEQSNAYKFTDRSLFRHR